MSPDPEKIRQKVRFIRDRLPAFVRMVGFRNRAVHLRDEIEPAQILRILEQDLGDFEVFIGAMVKRYLGPA